VFGQFIANSSFYFGMNSFLAIRRRFFAVAAKRNSSWAPLGTGPIAKWCFLLASLGWPEVLRGRANILVVFDVEDEIGTARSAVVMLLFIPG
jgi:hypothetical protein